MVIVKRERWVNKFVYTIRDSKGNFLTWKRAEKGDTKDILKAKYIKDLTFKPDTHIRPIVNFKEITESKKLKSGKGNNKYQYFITVSMKDGSTLTARSRMKEYTYPISKARSEAEYKLYILLDGIINEPLESDADEGEKVFKAMDIQVVDEGTIKYAKI